MDFARHDAVSLVRWRRAFAGAYRAMMVGEQGRTVTLIVVV